MANDVDRILTHLQEGARQGSSARAVFADPVRAEGRTVIPVARVWSAYGAGGGEGAPDPARGDATGGGGGAALRAWPAGVIEVTPRRTRFVAIGRGRRLALGFALGAALGLVVGSLGGAGPGARGPRGPWRWRWR